MMPNAILLVELPQKQALRLRQELQSYGLSVEIAGDRYRGQELARIYQPDAIVIDGDLPELGAHDFCRLLRTDVATSHIPVIMLSQHETASAVLAAFRTGAQDYIIRDTFLVYNLVESLRSLHVL